MFPLIFCSLCAQKLWRVRTFLEMTNVCATTLEQVVYGSYWKQVAQLLLVVLLLVHFSITVPEVSCSQKIWRESSNKLNRC